MARPWTYLTAHGTVSQSASTSGWLELSPPQDWPPPAVAVVTQHELGAIPNIEEHHHCQNHPSEHETDSKTHMAGAPCRP